MFITIAFYLQNIWHDGYGHDTVVVFAGWELNVSGRNYEQRERAHSLFLFGARRKCKQGFTDSRL